MARKNTDAAALDFCQSVGLLVRKARSFAVSDELSWTEMGVLRRLSKDGPATTAELARVQGMKPQSMRTIVGQLDQLGMVERRSHPTDGRQVNLELTAKGAAVQKRAGDAKRTWVVEAIAQLPGVEQETLFAAGEIIKKLLEDERP
jgi:DNA-binding MarR family transcriptional regulator